MRLRNVITNIAGLAVAASLAAAPAVAAESGALGTWLTEDGDSRIQIAPCGNTLCGTVVWLREPYDTDGEPHRDDNNPNPALRDRELLGMRIFYDLVEVEPGQQWRGRVYNPKNGNTYLAYLTVVSNNRLDVKGCVLNGLICGTQPWTRVGDSVTTGSATN